MNFKLTAFAALLLVPGQAMAEEVRVDCVTDQRIICRDDETTCREPVRETGRYHFTFDLTKKTGSLVFCSEGTGCMKPVRSLSSTTGARSSTITARAVSPRRAASMCGSR